MAHCKIILVEDEELARQRLKHLLQAHSDKIEIIGEAADGITAVEMINRLRPDALFLDIQMPGLTGFEVLKQIEHMPQVIFTTAYDQYALQAFEANSIDYLLKPVEQERLDRAIAKLKSDKAEVGMDQSDLLRQLGQLLDKKETSFLRRIQVKVGNKILLLGLDEVSHFESEDKYTTVVTPGKRHIIDLTLVELEQKLDPARFIRIHRSCLVNVDWIAEIHRAVGGKLQILLRDPAKTLLTVSRSYVDQIRNL